jgi:SAM-dependent methyltransferase
LGLWIASNGIHLNSKSRVEHVAKALGRPVIAEAHRRLVFHRRVDVLATEIAKLLPSNARVLDIGCGSGEIAAAILSLRSDVSIDGIDVLVRPKAAIAVEQFDGNTIPRPPGTYDAAILVDVLHHTDEPHRVLSEAARVAGAVILKDHLRDGFAAWSRLRFMDWVGNAPHGVRLPYNYLSRAEWDHLFGVLHLRVDEMTDSFRLYPFPADLVFGRGLHFIARLSQES